jgi:dihydroneopterin aldolase
MQLLVSVSNEAEAAAALEGGADLIDAKDPSSGALGAVSIAVFEKIAATVAGRRPLTAAIGDAIDETSIAHTAREFARRGAALVKVGFAATDEDARVEALLSAAVSGAASAERGGCGVIAVAYADVGRPESTARWSCGRARGARAFCRHGRQGRTRPRDLVDAHALAAPIADARDAGVLVALAGRLRPHDLPVV